MSSWARQHHGEIRALVIEQQDDTYLITVIEPPEENRIPNTYSSRDEDDAKNQADTLVRTHYPHDCQTSGCGDWTEHNIPSIEHPRP